jgi:lauroyl/myristoyl acyltransferase
MTEITLHMSDETEDYLRKQAARVGRELEDLIEEWVREEFGKDHEPEYFDEWLHQRFGLERDEELEE